MKEKLKAGVAIREISPEKGVELAGYPHYPRHNTGIHDPLYASCIYLDDGTTRLVIVTLDLLFYSKGLVRAIRNEVERETGIPGKNIMLCCSHTHSGPWAAGRLDLESLEKGLKPDPDYIRSLQGNLKDLIVEAQSHPFEARIGTAIGQCGGAQGVGGNRRDPKGLCDDTVNVLGIQDLQGNWRGCLVGYALHPTVIHGESTVVTADYPGYIRNYLSWSKPGMVMLFAQGTSGNQSTRYFRHGQNFEEACRIGTTLGVEVDRVLQQMNTCTEVCLQVESVETKPSFRQFPDEVTAEREVANAKEKLARLKAGNAPYIDIRNAELKVLGAEDILGYILMEKRGIQVDLAVEEIPLEIQAITLGDTCILGLQGEAFVEFGLTIKSRSPYGKTFVFELANGAAPGYIYTPESLEEGGYETDTSMLDSGFGDQVVSAAAELMKKTIK